MKQISFTRSGGFVAAPGMQIQATVSFPPEGQTAVKTNNAEYSRTLSTEEARRLQSADLSKLSARQDTRSHTSAGADQYQYDITITTDDGKTRTVTVGGQPAAELNQAAPGLGDLADWVRAEAERIWQKRIGQE